MSTNQEEPNTNSPQIPNQNEPTPIEIQPQHQPLQQNTLFVPKTSNTLTITFPNQDLIEVQNELLAKITNLESRIFRKINEIESSTTDSFLIFSNQISELSHKIDSLTKLNAEHKNKILKIDDFDSFKRKADDQLITHEIRINNTIKDLSNAQFKYDKLFTSNLTVPGYVGECSQFKTIAEYIDYNINLVESLVISREKMQNELKQNKQASETLFKDYVKIIDTKEKRCNEYTDKKMNEVMLKFNDNKRDVSDKFMELRVENTKTIKDFTLNMNNFMSEWNQIVKMKEDIFAKLSDHLFIYKTDFNTSQKKFEEIIKEFKKIKGRFGEMVDFIKDVRFRRNIGTVDVKKKEIDSLIRKIQYGSSSNNNNKNRRKSMSIDLNESKDIDLNYNFYTGGKVESEPEGPQKRKSFKNLMNTLSYKEDIQQHNATINNPKSNDNSNYISKQQQYHMYNNNNNNTQFNLKQNSDKSTMLQRINKNENNLYQHSPNNISADNLHKKSAYDRFRVKNHISQTNPLYRPLKTQANFRRVKIDPLAKLVELDFDNCFKNEKIKDDIFSFPSPQHYYQGSQDYNNKLNSQMKTINTTRNTYHMNPLLKLGGNVNKKFKSLNITNYNIYNKNNNYLSSNLNTINNTRKDYINCSSSNKNYNKRMIILNKRK